MVLLLFVEENAERMERKWGSVEFERGVRRRVTSFWVKKWRNFESPVPDRFLAVKLMNFFYVFFFNAFRSERKGGRCCGRPFIDLYSTLSPPPLPFTFVSHPPLRSTRDGYLLNARVPFVPAVYEQLRTTSTKFHVSLGQIEFARPRKRPSRSQSPVPSILTILAPRNSIIKYPPLTSIQPVLPFPIFLYIYISPSNSINRNIFISPGNCFTTLFFRMKLGNSSFPFRAGRMLACVSVAFREMSYSSPLKGNAYFYTHLCFYHGIRHICTNPSDDPRPNLDALECKEF